MELTKNFLGKNRVNIDRKGKYNLGEEVLIKALCHLYVEVHYSERN